MDEHNVPDVLRRNIRSRIQTYEYTRAKRVLTISFVSGIISLGGVTGSVWYLATSLYQSSFYYYLTLVVSDTDLVLLYWREFALSLAETLPLFGLTLVLVGVVALLVSLRMYVRYRPAEFRPSFSI